MKNSDFVHLHVHSHYSLLDGLGTPEALVLRAKELGMEALALTDHGAMYGAIEFYKAAKKEGIKPIIGVETYVAPRLLTDKVSKLDSSPYHLTLFAKNMTGYRNMMKLVSIAHLEGFYYKPRVDKKTLKKYAEGLIASSACLGGEIPRHILSKDLDQAEKAIKEYQDIFGKDDFYLEIQNHPEIEVQQGVNEELIKLSKTLGAPLIASADIHYPRKEDREAHDVLVCVQTGKTIDDPKRMIYTGDYSMIDPQDLAKAFKDSPEALENTKKLADKCDLKIPFEENLLPPFPLPKGVTEDEYLRQECEKAIAIRFKDADSQLKKTSQERLEYELGVISRMGFASYFLIVADYVRWAKQKRIMVGPGRGSGAGSLVSFLMGITDIDPLKYNLLFERFLNPDRNEMPDIDLDFADHRRNEVLEYISQKYGDNHVAGIITFGTMAARAAVRDTGRALGFPYAEVDAIAKLVPPPVQGKHIPLSKSIKENKELKSVYQSDPRAKRLLDMACQLEGTVRHASQHASAFVITSDELPCYVPLQLAQKEGVKQITQYSMYPVASLGLLKMDLLGLSNLTTIERALDMIEAVHPEVGKIDIHNLPLDDAKTFQTLSLGETTGVFQLESSGMKRYIKELKPNSLEDIAAMVALYRPGPMQFIDSYIRRKQGKEKVTYPHQMTQSALKSTYGIPVYQEQVMQVSRDMAGFTGGEADTLRKAMGKKIAKLMAQMKEKFILGCENNGISTKQATEVFSMLEDFAAYGFNKSHAVCYGMIAYQTAYLKAHYPECFMAALLTADLGDTDRIAIEISECERMGIKVLPPDVNESFVDFGVVKESGNLRFGLEAIKNIGENPAKIIVRERKKNGPFKSFEDFIDRMSKTDVEESVELQGSNSTRRVVINKKVIDALAKSGALDSMAERSQVLEGMEIIIKRIQETTKQIKSSQIGLFGEVLSSDIELGKLELPGVEPATRADRLSWEKELLGIYLSEHPLKEFGEQLQKLAKNKLGLLEGSEGTRVKVAGIITQVKKITTKRGQPMLFVGLEDLSGKAEIIVFPNLLQAHPEVFQPDSLVLIEGKISTKDDEIKILADSANKIDPDALPEGHMITVSEDEDEIVEINLNDEPSVNTLTDSINECFEKGEYLCESEGKVYVVLPKGTSKDNLVEIKKVLESFKGTTKLVLAFKKDGEFQFVSTKVAVRLTGDLKTRIKKILE